jgi:SOS-response transcriptional repressor LexA
MRTGRKPIEEITEKQKEILVLIIDCIRQNGYQPSRDELAVAVGATSHAVTQRVDQLVRKGYLELAPSRGERRLRIPGLRFIATRNDDLIDSDNAATIDEILTNQETRQ